MIGIIKTGDYELLDSRIVQILETEETTLAFDDSSIVFVFQNTEDKEPSIKVETLEAEKTIKFVLMNVSQPSYGTTDFFSFGKSADGKDVYISFRIHSLNDKKIRSLEYSIYKK